MTTRSDVAKLAGVSPSTVSRVLNNNGYVADEVKKRVLQVISDLKYIPNRAARSLRLQQYHQVACIAPSVVNSFYHEVIAGVEEAALDVGYTFSWYTLKRDRISNFQSVLEGFYDGLIFLAPFEFDGMVDLNEISERLPTCVYSDRGNYDAIPSVSVDLREAMRLNIEYLISCGHQRIFFLGNGFQDLRDNPRYQGYLDALRNHDIPPSEALVHLIPNHRDTISYGYGRVKAIVDRGVQFSAIAASNDLLAVGAVRALKDRGIDVPRDVSVTGVDDVEIANFIVPSLTTTRIPKRAIGRQLMQLLLKQINGEYLPTTSIEMTTDLIIRESVATLD